MSDTSKIQLIKTEDLHFDPNNPRFYRLNNSNADEGAVIEDMLDDEGVPDLMRSIGQKGYFQGEPLLVAEEDNKLIVVEGNRRLASVKLLNEQIRPPKRRTKSVEEIINKAVVAIPSELPCIVYDSRRDVLRYLGYRHITGIKEWDSLSKARYLYNIRKEFYEGLSVPEQMKSLANDIGSRSDYVAQLLTSLGLYEKAEESDFFDLPITSKDISFSYITTALNYANITSWLGLESRRDINQTSLDNDNLKSLFSWIFSKDQQGRTILGESRNLDKLSAVVANEDAIASLKESGSLETAYLYSDGPNEALIKTLDNAIKSSSSAWNLLVQTHQMSDEHLSLSEELFSRAKDIRNHIRSKLDDE